MKPKKDQPEKIEKTPKIINSDEKKSKEAKNIKVDSDLVNIYTNGDGELTDVSKLDVKKNNLLKNSLFIFAFAAVFLAALSWLGFFIFSKNSNSKSINLKITAEKEISSGQNIIYAIEYENTDRVALHNVEISILYPDYFIYEDADPLPENQYNTLWKIGELAKGQKGKIEIKGRVVGEVGSVLNFQATASYAPANYSSSFKDTFSAASQITTSILDIELAGPSNTLPEKKVTYKINYKNNSEQDIDNVQIKAFYPDGFIFQEANPAPSAAPNLKNFSGENSDQITNVWYFEKIANLSEGVIEISGGYLISENLSKDLIVQIGLVNDDNFTVQQEKSVNTLITGQNLKLDLIINGNSADKAVNFGDTLNYSIVYKNLGNETLKNVNIIVNIASDIVDWDTLIDKNMGEAGINQINWDKNNVASLAQINPLDEGSLDFSVKLKGSENINLKTANLLTTSVAKAIIGEINDLEAQTVIESKKINNNINTALELKTEGRYFNDDNIAVGAGPLPPVVGQKTTFRIFWYLSNNLHEAKNVKIQTKLPAGISWEDKYLVKSGELNYSPTDNAVTWNISKISSNKTFDDVNVWFDVSVTPTKDQSGRLILLTAETNLTATDAVTDDTIVQLQRSITSNLEDDPIGGGRGLVIDIE